MQAGIPILACTDPNTDIGKIITDGRFGLWCQSRNVADFVGMIEKSEEVDFVQEDELKYLVENYTTEKCYQHIIEAVGNKHENQKADSKSNAEDM